LKLPPCRRTGKTLTIGLPESILSSCPHLREKTALAGFVGRAATVFRVDRILLYRDSASKGQDAEPSLLGKLLCYLDTPQYLRKLLFPIDDDLKYAGILPPLRGPHHLSPNEIRDISAGALRDGIVVDSSYSGSQVEVGLDKRVPLIDPVLEIGSRVTVKMLRTGRDPLARLALPREIRTYWGYVVFDSRMTLGSLLLESNFDLVIATSRRGDAWSRIAPSIGRELAGADSTLLLFGSYKAGLQEILSHESLKLDDVVQFTVNTIPSQGTATVRTEEALYASLALLRVLEEIE
jgi:predicted SPOUT superfamily RNA methylase MTH1